MSSNCCKPKNKQSSNRGKVDSFVVIIAAVTILILGGAVYLGSKMGQAVEVTPDSQVELAVNEKTHNWGTIDIDGGIVSKSFMIENKSQSPLKLYDVKTSCMCTTAQLITSEQTSKKFGMHEKTSSMFEVKPGDTAELSVEFDPAFHGPSGVGQISRIITISTNDPDNPTLNFQLNGNVVKN